ncbi:GNAT family N-acetyltransferase [Glaciihabitans sp. UYNi722]|uniref:GNAT family N-acetyltransferase n=1 Tax=Glaciihabitans sp. UYNi722 TaxID=3156344 RepID=UPI00339B55CD
MTEFMIDEITIPATLQSPEAADFIATVDVRNVVEADGYGSDELSFSADELLPGWLDQEFEPKRLFAVRVDGRVVGRATYETQTAGDAEVVWLGVQVLPEFRRRGIGTALADHLEAIADSERRGKRIVCAVSKDAAGERLDE